MNEQFSSPRLKLPQSGSSVEHLCTVFSVTVAKDSINTYHFVKLFSSVSFTYLHFSSLYFFLTISITFAAFTFAAHYLSIYSSRSPLQGLKKNWEGVQKEFQSLSVFTDSIPKKTRKQKLEEEMKQLEHDIGVIEKHKIIYIANK